MVVRSQQTQGFCGQLFGLIIALVGLALATYAAISGQPWFGSIIGGATLVGLVSAFLYSRYAENKDLRQKQEQVRRMKSVQGSPSSNPKGNKKQKHGGGAS
jgi:hypothetical protein